MGTELFRADGRTDMTKLIVALHNFANASKNRLQAYGKENSGRPMITEEKEEHPSRHNGLTPSRIMIGCLKQSLPHMKQKPNFINHFTKNCYVV